MGRASRRPDEGRDPQGNAEAMGEARTQAVRCRQILDAARTCFGRHGFHGASMARIADEARISVGHIYRYFESKESVVAAIAEEDLARAAEDLAAIDGAPDRLAARLLEGFLTCHTADQAALWLEILSEAARNPRIAGIMREMEARMRTHMRGALMRSCAGRQEADAAAMDVRIDTVFALLDGVTLRRFKQGGELGPAQLREMEAVLRAALAAPLQALEPSEAQQAEGQGHAVVGDLLGPEQYGRHYGSEAQGGCHGRSPARRGRPPPHVREEI